MYFNFSRHNFIMATTCRDKKKTDDYIFLSTLKHLNLNKKLVVSIKQTHSNKINFVKSPGFHNTFDGLITKKKYKLILVVKTADCVPIFIYDNNKGIYGVIHAGWRGVNKKIHIKAIKKFIKLDSNLCDIHVFLGPSIKECCFEIKKDVVQLFDDKFIENINNKFFLDLNKCIKSDLNKVGINKIEVDKNCSYDIDKCHSYRRDGKLAGRMNSLIAY